MKRKAILSLFAALPLVATLAFAGHDGECADHGSGGHEKGGHHGRRHGDHGMFFKRHLDELDLTAEQQKKIDAIFESAKKDRGDRKELRAEYKKLHELLEQDKPNEKAINAQVEKIGEMKTDHHKAMLKTLLAVRAELTPEQRQKLAEMKSKRGERRGRHHDHEKGSEKSEAKPDAQTE